jgi:dTMP kinase
MRGRFITFEGGEGTGKSTQAELLAQRLRSLGVSVVLTREPGGSPGAEVLRHVLLSGAAEPFGPEAEAVLFAAARADHIACTIRPALDKGRWVICDRFIDSTRVYQGAVGRVDKRIIKGLERVTVGDLVPDLTFVLDIDPATGLARAASRRGAGNADRFENQQVEFHARLRAAYRAIAEADPQRCVLIDADRPKEAIAEEIWSIVNRRLEPATAPLILEEVHS